MRQPDAQARAMGACTISVVGEFTVNETETYRWEQRQRARHGKSGVLQA